MKFGAGLQFGARVLLLLLVSSAPIMAAQSTHLSIDASKAGATSSPCVPQRKHIYFYPVQ